MTDFRPCRECRDWNGCLLTESERHWFGYQHIRFCKHHVFFLLKYEEIIRGRAWPTDEEALGGRGCQALSDATWVSASVVLAELDARLDRIRPSLKGELLRNECKTRDRIEYLSDDAKDALYYVSGIKRKGTPFTAWLAKRRYKKYTPLKTTKAKGRT